MKEWKKMEKKRDRPKVFFKKEWIERIDPLSSIVYFHRYFLPLLFISLFKLFLRPFLYLMRREKKRNRPRERNKEKDERERLEKRTEKS